MTLRIVVKVGGRVQSAEGLPRHLAGVWDASNGCVCVVHGGGDEISVLQRQLGLEPTFVNGRRITSEEDLEILRMVLSGSANKRLVASLVAAGIRAVGISGEDAGMIGAAPMDGGPLGRAGKPTRIDPELIETLIAAGYMPVVSPVATDVTSDSGAPINVNGDDAAAAIASALNAELWLIADVPGVMDAQGDVITSLDPAQTEELVADSVVNGGMRAKLEAGFAALTAGAAGVRIADLRSLSDPARGTTLFLLPGMP
ncbi:MAG: acetylglutamate kinase [Gemmatimonadaceae bacterium]|nr:acetylglutamate kinase [Gemmatimonadaceae bacterium]